MIEKALELKGVGMRFAESSGDDNEVFSDISFYVVQGQFVSLLGPSGCGKSTLLRLIAGLLKPSWGTVGVQSCGSLRVGYVPQSYSLFPWLTVRQNIEFGLSLRGFPKVECEIRATGLLATLKLQRTADLFPQALSGGMKQRIAIARALAIEPNILLLDEPFGALDMQTRSIMQDFLLDAWMSFKGTVMFVTHSVEEAIYLSDRILVLTVTPSQIAEDLSVGISRPRNPDHRLSSEFLAMRHRIEQRLRHEAIRSEV